MKKLLLSLACLLGIASFAMAEPLTLSFGTTDNNFGFPADKNSVDSEDAEYTYDGVTLTVKGVYKGKTAKYLMVTQGGYLSLPAFDQKVTSISVLNSSDCSTKAKLTLSADGNEIETKDLSKKSEVYTWNIPAANQAEGTIYKLASSGANTQIVEITISFEGDVAPINVEAPVFSVEAGFVTVNTVVEISCATEGAVIYYTLDKSEPTNESIEYTEPIVLDEVGMVDIKAIAYVGDNVSPVSTVYYDVVEGEGEDVSYKLVKSLDDVTLNDEYIIYCAEAKGLMGANNGSIFTFIANIEAVDETITVNNLTGAQPVAIVASETEGCVAFKVGEKFISCTSNSANGKTPLADENGANCAIQLAGMDTEGTEEKAPTYAIDMVFAANSNNGSNKFQCNNNKSQERFTNYYKGGQKNCQLYKKADSTDTGIQNVAADANAPVVYYNLQGVRVANPNAGVYVRVQGNKASKVLVK